MNPNPIRDAKHWRERAAQMRVLALNMADPETKVLMEKLASDYDKLADKAAEPGGDEPKGRRRWSRVGGRH